MYLWQLDYESLARQIGDVNVSPVFIMADLSTDATDKFRKWVIDNIDNGEDHLKQMIEISVTRVCSKESVIGWGK